MKAIICGAVADGFDHLEFGDASIGDPGPGEVRVRVRAASINFPDLLMAEGKYQFRPPLPFIPGVEGSGDVVAVGDGVTRFRPGDRVVIRPRFGAFAEEIVLPETDCRSIPGAMGYAEAAAYSVGSMTAYVALVRCAALQEGETLLVHGAAGGVGLACIELAKILGATVIATASSAAKREAALRLGADHALDSGTPFRDAIMEITGGRGVDMVYDPVGGDVFDQSLRCLTFGGKLLVIGFTSGRIPTLPVNIALLRNASILGVRAGEYVRKFPERGREIIAAIDALAAEGRIRPHIHARLPLQRAAEAMRLLQDRQVIGKVVIEM